METITQRDLRNNSAAVMDGVEAGERYRVTRNGTEIAELRPVTRRQRRSAEELVARHAQLPNVDYTNLREEVAAYFGEERVEDDPYQRNRD